MIALADKFSSSRDFFREKPAFFCISYSVAKRCERLFKSTRLMAFSRDDVGEDAQLSSATTQKIVCKLFLWLILSRNSNFFYVVMPWAFQIVQCFLHAEYLLRNCLENRPSLK
jgi:hypothetical protein